MGTMVTGYSVIVVSQSAKLDRMSGAAVEKLGSALRSGRAVKAEAKRFAAKVAAKPSILCVDILDVAGLSNPTSGGAGDREPIVLHEGKFVPVSHTYLMVCVEHHVVASQDLDNSRDGIIAACARRIAEDVLLGGAMAAAIFNADADLTLAGMSSHSATCTVTLDGDDDGKIAKRLPKWIKVEGHDKRSVTL